MRAAGAGHGERGSVTAELAIGLPGVVATVLLVLGALLAGATYVECQEAARIGAREVMLHGSAAQGRAAAQEVAGPGAGVDVAVDGRWVTVRVQKSVFVDSLPIHISAQMTALVEPGGPL